MAPRARRAQRTGRYSIPQRLRALGVDGEGNRADAGEAERLLQLRRVRSRQRRQHRGRSGGVPHKSRRQRLAWRRLRQQAQRFPFLRVARLDGLAGLELPTRLHLVRPSARRSRNRQDKPIRHGPRARLLAQPRGCRFRLPYLIQLEPRRLFRVRRGHCPPPHGGRRTARHPPGRRTRRFRRGLRSRGRRRRRRSVQREGGRGRQSPGAARGRRALRRHKRQRRWPTQSAEAR